MTAKKHVPDHYWDFPAELPPGAWNEKRVLASAVRDLVALCVTTDAPQEELAAVSAQVREAVARLSKHARGTFLDAFTKGTIDDITRFADRGTMVGLSNPMSPPMTMTDDGETVTAHVNFGPPFEGAPGCVHGGLLAAAFDQALGFLNVARKVGSMTATLSVKYRKPTPLQKPLRIEARVDRIDGRKRWVSARMYAPSAEGEELTAEAEGLFIALDAGKLDAIVARVRAPDEE
jgi:acyl-coenzyme A thioesterase PaaI-like protein